MINNKKCNHVLENIIVQKVIKFLIDKDNQLLIVCTIIAISLFKIAFWGIVINDIDNTIYTSSTIDGNITSTIDGHIATDNF